MLTEDYIMRMISLAIAVLMTALGLKKAGKYDEAGQALDQAVENLLGVKAHLADKLEDSVVLGMLTFLGRLDVERLLILAQIYYEKAELFVLQERLEDYQTTALRSMRFYLEYTLNNQSNPEVEIISKIESIRHKLNTADLPDETRLALMDYFDRLLSMDDKFIEEAGLQRPEIVAELSSINRQGFV